MSGMSNGEDDDRVTGAGLNGVSPRDRLIEAFMALLAERRFERIDLKDVADRAGVPLVDFRGEFGSTFDILGAFAKKLDRQVLAEVEPADADSTPRERLFDVMMRRFELLVPYRQALDNLRPSAFAIPPLGVALSRITLRSMQWMMAAAGLETAGTRGMVRAQALAVLFARVFETWLTDEDPALSRTMAKLDRELAKAAAWSSRFEELCNFIPRLPRGRRSWRQRRSGCSCAHAESTADRSGDEGIPAAAI